MEAPPAVLEKDHRRRVEAQPHGQMMRPKVAFVDLVDSDEDEDDKDPGAKEELDLELKL